jgi:Flp pilus assembly protein TadD
MCDQRSTKEGTVQIAIPEVAPATYRTNWDTTFRILYGLYRGAGRRAIADIRMRKTHLRVLDAGYAMSSFTDNDPNAVLQQALRLHQSGKIAQAATLYRQLLRQIPPRPPILNLLGTAELQLGNTQEGVSLLGQSLAIDPNQPDVLCNRGIGLQKLTRFDEALAVTTAPSPLSPAMPKSLTTAAIRCRALNGPRKR